ncbi:MAG: VIT1/CCC1 transporter family protein [Candidatus Rokubacteria bacterium]|nr:VIT1/CCC1 transporter family protein [Candidatus Rokubacteria bacterium]
MAAPPHGGTARLGRALVLDELFDLSLYRALRETTRGDLRAMLDELIPIETKHFQFWQRFFGIDVSRLDPWRRVRLALLILICRLVGDRAIHLVLEAIEIHGVKKYLALWELYRDGPLGEAVREVLDDELRHEDRVVSESIERRIDAESVRSLFLGFNDGLVEILGAVSGFFAAFQDAASILVASSTVAVAGAFSMAAGAFVASSSEREITRLEADKHAFLGERPAAAGGGASPLRAALLVGVSYLLGAMVPVLPVLLGARTIAVPLLTAGVVTVVVSAILAFLSGMAVRRRLTQNVLILAAAVAVTYAVGLLARTLWGIAVS